jgi:branched-chain amino acid transport system ATP-binding protein
MLEIRALQAGYGDVGVLFGVDLTVGQGEIVSLVGANGAGKTTTLRAISGLIRPSAGDITFEGKSIVGLKPHEIVRLGVAHVPEGRQLFPEMTVEENLRMGANQLPAALARAGATLERVYAIFTRLRERRTQMASTLSGGEQQMLAIGRGLMSLPRLLILDEPSLGIAPMLVTQILDTVVAINREGVSVLLVEQNLQQSLRRSHRGYVLENGEIVISGVGHALLDDPRTRKAFLGLED